MLSLIITVIARCGSTLVVMRTSADSAAASFAQPSRIMNALRVMFDSVDTIDRFDRRGDYIITRRPRESFANPMPEGMRCFFVPSRPRNGFVADGGNSAKNGVDFSCS